MRYTFTEAVGAVLGNVEPSSPAVQEIQSQQLHRWIGEAHMGASGRLQGPGNAIEYAEKDIRRAVAYLRLRALIGAGIGADAQMIRERVREVASWHTDGWVMILMKDLTPPFVDWTSSTEEAASFIARGYTVLVVPCAIGQLRLPL